MARSRSWRTGSSTPGPRLPSAACLRAVGRPERLVRCGRAYRTGLLDQTLAVLSSLMKGKKKGATRTEITQDMLMWLQESKAPSCTQGVPICPKMAQSRPWEVPRRAQGGPKQAPRKFMSALRCPHHGPY